jgi:hypothetical protein
MNNICLSFCLFLLFRQSLLYDSEFDISIRTRLISTIQSGADGNDGYGDDGDGDDGYGDDGDGNDGDGDDGDGGGIGDGNYST